MSSKTATAELKEIEGINNEISRLREAIKKLDIRKKKLEGNIQLYKNKTNKNEIKTNKTVAKVINKPVRKRRNDKDKIAIGQSILEEYGVRNGNMMMPKILEAMRGELIDREKVVYEKIKK